MIRALLLLELRRSRMILAGLSLLVIAYSGLLGLVFPSIRENAAQLDKTFEAYPEDFLVAFGLEGSLADPGVYYTANIGVLLWPLVAAMIGIVLATRPTAIDTERGWIEMPLAGRLTRREYLAVGIAVQVIGIALLAFATEAAFVGVGALVDARFDAGRFVLAGVAAWLFGAAVAAVTTLLGVLTLSRAVAGGIVAGGLLVMYLFRIVANVVDELAILGDLSVFNYLYPTTIIQTGALPIVEVLAFVVIAAACWIWAVAAFERRDLIA